MLVLIGSKAINQHIPGFRNNPADTDVMCCWNEFIEWSEGQSLKSVYPSNDGKKMIAVTSNDSIYEFELTDYSKSAKIFVDLASKSTLVVDDMIVPELNLLFTLKCSHRFLKNSKHFDKTMLDYHYLKDFGCHIAHGEFLRLREKETYAYKHPNLNKSKDQFFDKKEINYLYDHDSIHESVKIGDKPAYKYYQIDEVKCSKNLFDQLPHRIKINAVLEESYVLALERSQIPHGHKITAKQSFLIALQKVCTSITSGWFREFAYDNYYNILERYDDEYVNKFKNDLAKGVIQSYAINK